MLKLYFFLSMLPPFGKCSSKYLKTVFINFDGPQDLPLQPQLAWANAPRPPWMSTNGEHATCHTGTFQVMNRVKSSPWEKGRPVWPLSDLVLLLHWPHYSLLPQPYQLSSCILFQSFSKKLWVKSLLKHFPHSSGREKETDGGHLPTGPARGPQPGVPLAGRGMIDGSPSCVCRGGCLCLILSS